MTSYYIYTAWQCQEHIFILKPTAHPNPIHWEWDTVRRLIARCSSVTKSKTKIKRKIKSVIKRKLQLINTYFQRCLFVEIWNLRKNGFVWLRHSVVKNRNLHDLDSWHRLSKHGTVSQHPSVLVKNFPNCWKIGYGESLSDVKLNFKVSGSS